MANLDSLDIKISANANNAIRSLKRLSDQLNVVASSLNNVNGAGLNQLTSSLQGLTNAINSSQFKKLSNLGSNLGKISTSASNVSVSTRKASSGLNLFSKSSRNAQTAGKGLASVIGKVYASYWLLFRAFSVFRKAIDFSSSLTEVQNVVEQTFGGMTNTFNQFAKDAKFTLGMSELTAKEIGSRYQAMGQAMNISSSAMKKTDEWVKNINKDFVVADGSASGMSTTLTKLAGDMASFYNKDQKDVAQDLEAIYTGMTRPLRKYGLDLTQATLKEWALKNGMDADIESMSQAQKALLRYKYVLANTKNAQGDFERTIDTWANQTRILKEQFVSLGSTIGSVFINAFKPVVKHLNNVLQAVNEFAVKVANALGNIFGWTYEGNDVGILGTDGEDFADNLEDGAKSAKKIKDYVMGIDELNINNPNSGNGGSGDGDGSGGGFDDGKTAMGHWVKNYESDIDTLFDLGRKISDTLEKAMRSIDWDNIYSKASNFGKGLASYLNGLIKPSMFEALGETIAGGLNTITYAIQNFSKTFDWQNLGKSIKELLLGFIDKIDIDAIKDTLSTLGAGLAKSLNGLIDPELFAKVGESISEGLNGLTGAIKSFVDTFDWSNFGKSVKDGLLGLLNSFDIELFKSTCESLGKSISDAINSFLDPELAGKFASSVADMLNGIIDGAKTFLTELDAEKIGDSIATAINGWFETFDFDTFAETANTFKDKIFDTIKTAIQNINWKGVWNGINRTIMALDGSTILLIVGAFFTNAVITDIRKRVTEALAGAVAKMTLPISNLAVSVGSVVVTAIAGFVFGNWVASLFGDDLNKELRKNFHFIGEGGFFDEITKSGEDTVKALIAMFKWENIINVKNFKSDPIGTVVAGLVKGNVLGPVATVLDSLNYIIVEGTKNKVLLAIEVIEKGIKKVLEFIQGNETLLKNSVFSGFFSKIKKDADELKPTLNSNDLGKYIQGADKDLKGLNTTKENIKFPEWLSYSTSFALKLYDAFKQTNKPVSDLGTTFETTSVSAKKLYGSAQEITGEIKTLSKDTDSNKSSFSSWATSVGGNFKTTFNQAKSSISEWQNDNKSKRNSEKTDFNSWVAETKKNLGTTYDKSKESIKAWSEDAKQKRELMKSGFATWGEDVKKNLKETFDKVGDNFSSWWENDVTPWFTLDKWKEQFNNVKSAFSEKWDEIASWWNTSVLGSWWKNDVEPLFDKDKWSFSGIKDGIEQSFENAIAGIKKIWNSFAEFMNDKLKFEWDSFSVAGHEIVSAGSIKLGKLPTFATGGFPEDGLFMANHGELVGGFANGRTAVANNEQIIDGIKAGVTEAILGSLSGYLNQLVTTNTQIANKNDSLMIDGRELVSAYNSRKYRNGFSFTD